MNEEKEFLTKGFQTLMKEHSIMLYTTASDLKASMDKGFNHTLKSRIWWYFTAKKYNAMPQHYGKVGKKL